MSKKVIIIITLYKINTGISKILTESRLVVSYCTINKPENCYSPLYSHSKFGIWLLSQQYILWLTHWGRVTQICVFYITTVQDGW